MRRLLLAVLLAGCLGEESDLTARKVAKVAKLNFEIPEEWSQTNIAEGPTTASMFTPTQSNSRKESIAVIRVEGAAQKIATTPIEQLVAGAQGALRDARVMGAHVMSTEHGFAGAEVQVTFHAGPNNALYRRAHATLVDGKDLVHVFYTAIDPDPKLVNFNKVLETLQHGEG